MLFTDGDFLIDGEQMGRLDVLQGAAVETSGPERARGSRPTGDETALDGYDVERLKAESLRIVGELPELFRGVDSSRLRGEGPGR